MALRAASKAAKEEATKEMTEDAGLRLAGPRSLCELPRTSSGDDVWTRVAMRTMARAWASALSWKQRYPNPNPNPNPNPDPDH